jgi:hypothetical protein
MSPWRIGSPAWNTGAVRGDGDKDEIAPEGISPEEIDPAKGWAGELAKGTRAK